MARTNSPIYVVGVGRSGTSLLQSMLAAHPSVGIPPETGFLRRYVANGELSKVWRKAGAQRVAEKLDADEYFQRTGLDARALLLAASALGPFSDGVTYRAMLLAVADREGKPRFGDKDPRSVEFLGLVRAVFGDVHVVHVIRDPRDVLVSKKKAAWSRNRGVLRHVFANRVQFGMGRTDGRRLFGDQYHEVIYEKLLADPEGELRCLCDGLGLSFTPSMLDFGESAKRLVSKNEMAWKKETLGPLLKDNQGKWEGVLSDWEIALTELVCGASFVAGGYERSDRIRHLSFNERLAVLGLAAVIMTGDPIYRIHRKWTVWRARKYV